MGVRAAVIRKSGSGPGNGSRKTGNENKYVYFIPVPPTASTRADAMIAVIFEALPHPDEKQANLDAAAALRPHRVAR